MAFRKVQNQSSVTSSTLSLAGWGKVAQKKMLETCSSYQNEKKGRGDGARVGKGREGIVFVVVATSYVGWTGERGFTGEGWSGC